MVVVDAESRGADAGRGDETALPRAFGKYVLFDHIGRGGMANIFLARMATEFGAARRVVVKEILPEYSAHARFETALVGEAKLAAQLSHHNIVRVLDLGREQGRLFIAMEYVEGFDLNQLLAQLSKRRLPLPAEFAFFIVREVLAALDYAHRASDAQGSPLAVVHRDVSPSNVLISFEGEVRLCDFGIARAFSADAGPPATRAGASDPGDTQVQQRVRLVGKCAYMAPEHARGAEIDARSDVFAAGILLWELCAGRRLYKGNEQEVLEQARSARIPSLPERGLPEPRRLRGILDRALSPDPALRFQSARQMLVELENYALDSQLMASQLRFASFLRDNFADAIVALRAGRERGADAALRAHALRREAQAREAEAAPPSAANPETPDSEPATLERPLEPQRTAERQRIDSPAPNLAVSAPETLRESPLPEAAQKFPELGTARHSPAPPASRGVPAQADLHAEDAAEADALRPSPWRTFGLLGVVLLAVALLVHWLGR